MATNTSDVNDVNGSTNDDSMEVEKLGTTDEAGEQQFESINRRAFEGPVSLYVCIHFILMSAIVAVANEYMGVYLNDVFQIILSKNTNETIDNVIIRLQEFADKFALNLYICIINKNGMEFRHLYSTSVHKSGESFQAFIVYDQRYQRFYPFYICDNNNKIQTTFSTKDIYFLQLFQDTVVTHNWPNNEEVIQQSSDVDEQNNEEENTSTTNASNDNRTETILNTSGVCNLLVQQTQNLILRLKPQLDSLKRTFRSSEYQFLDNDSMCPETDCKSLSSILQLLLELSDMTTRNLKTNASMEITEATAVLRDEALNNHVINILSNEQTTTDSSLPSNSQSTTVTNIDLSPITTNNFKQTINLPKPKLCNQQRRLWHLRYLESLVPKNSKNLHPNIQIEGAKQGTSLLFKLPKEINHYKQEFHLGAHAVTYDKKEHPQKLLVPTNTSIKEGSKYKSNDLGCLDVDQTKDDHDEFDQKTKGVFSKIKNGELEKLQKECTFKMVNLYQIDPITKDLVKDKKLQWCRLMFAIYIKTADGVFQQVSPPIFSDLIQDTNGAQTIETAVPLPNPLCERGGQMTFLPLDEAATKGNLDVSCNNKPLDQNKFQIAGNILSFESPAWTEGNNELDIKIRYKHTNRSASFDLFYHLHDDHLEPCGVNDED